MDATDRICRMLEERGVEYETDVLPNGKCGVSWIDGNDIEWEVVQQGENFEIHALQLVTPEQAVAATVGNGTCYNVGDKRDFCCSECGVRMFIESDDTYTMIASDERTIIKRPKFCPTAAHE